MEGSLKIGSWWDSVSEKLKSPEEILRIKAYLIVRRNATRDYIDFVALWDHLGVSRAQKALQELDALYPQEGDVTVTQQLAMQLSEPKPWDLLETDLGQYKSLKAPYTDWNEVKRRAALAGQKLIMLELNIKVDGRVK